MFGHIFLTGKSDQFKKYYHGGGDELKVKYDYMSIMHYGKDYFAKLDSERRHYLMTIKTKDPKYQNRIGQRRYLTPNDILMINTMYGCPGNTSHVTTLQRNSTCCNRGLVASPQLLDKLRGKKEHILVHVPTHHAINCSCMHIMGAKKCGTSQRIWKFFKNVQNPFGRGSPLLSF